MKLRSMKKGGKFKQSKKEEKQKSPQNIKQKNKEEVKTKIKKIGEKCNKREYGRK